MSGFQRAALCSSLFALVLLIGVVSSTNASAQTVRTLRPGSPEWLERCKHWVERKGYPVDYIEQKTGKRQPGYAVDWKGNIKPDEARVGDVAIISRTYQDGRTVDNAAYIDSVEPSVGGSGAFVTVSAFNQGRGRWVDQECHVGVNFGRVVQERVPLSSVVRVWRQSLPLE
jgi:hypothetical protein